MTTRMFASRGFAAPFLVTCSGTQSFVHSFAAGNAVDPNIAAAMAAAALAVAAWLLLGRCVVH